MPRKKSTEPQLIPIGLRLETTILERISKGERGLSKEIRTRLLRTIAEDDLDAATRELRDGLVMIAGKLRADFGTEWHASSRAHQAFAAAVTQWIADYAPPTEPASPSVEALFDPPEMVGRMRARDVQREGNFPQLEAAKQRRARRMTSKHFRAKKEGGNE